MFTPASVRPLRNGRITAPRNFFAGTPVHSAHGFVGSHPAPNGLATNAQDIGSVRLFSSSASGKLQIPPLRLRAKLEMTI
jgi:hypothetical protein